MPLSLGATTSDSIAYKHDSPAQIPRDNACSRPNYERRINRNQTLEAVDHIVPHVYINQKLLVRCQWFLWWPSKSRNHEPHALCWWAHFNVGSLRVPVHYKCPVLASSDLDATDVVYMVLSVPPNHRCFVSEYWIYICGFGVIGGLFSYIFDCNDGDVGGSPGPIRMLPSSMMIVTPLNLYRWFGGR